MAATQRQAVNTTLKFVSSNLKWKCANHQGRRKKCPSPRGCMTFTNRCATVRCWNRG